METIQEAVTIINKLGLHTRAAAKLVAIAAKFESKISLVKADRTVDAKSIMGVITLGASLGTSLDLIITGNDQKAARDAIIELINNRFGEPD
jgi:phosphocarrier protein HPr